MAVLVYLGVGISSFPTRLPDALSAYVGPSRADVLREQVESLLAEATLDEEWELGLVEATKRVRQKMQEAHPELSDDALSALGWNFSYSNK